ncbi:Allantoinase [Porphyridium purpureum]|uniref:allantoinase n=1 Tax=Porphyridium purpureum TaxID=35688 RepID=A0A5J4YT34_PORPP|nr:Allantoinase [Porphyridium purpureum]|eukprot:POR3262..scf229_5
MAQVLIRAGVVLWIAHVALVLLTWYLSPHDDASIPSREANPREPKRAQSATNRVQIAPEIARTSGEDEHVNDLSAYSSVLNALRSLPALRAANRGRYAIRTRRLVLGGEQRNVEEPQAKTPGLVVVGLDGTIEYAGSEDGLDEYGISAGSLAAVVDVGDLVVMPGLVDPHVHINEASDPDRTSWEGFASATKAAAAGGTTTILDMPLNCIPSTVSMSALRAKVEAMALSKLFVDVGLIGGVIPSNEDELVDLVERGGVLAFKSFMIDSQSADFPHVNLETLSRSMQVIGARFGTSIPYMLHAELAPEEAEGDKNSTQARRALVSESSYSEFMRSRPDAWEVDAVMAALDRAHRTGCHVHICHLSSVHAARLVRFARGLGANVTAETCTQYLLYSAEQIPDGRPEFKCAPPIRQEQNRRELWKLLIEGDAIQLIASDHSPTLPKYKNLDSGNVRDAWGGISGLQHRLLGVWTAATELGNVLSLEALSALLSEQPAAIFGLDGMKGRLAHGYDADLVIWDPEGKTLVTESNFYARHKVSPMLNSVLRGRVLATLVHGELSYVAWEDLEPQQQENSNLVSPGQLLVRTDDSGVLGKVSRLAPSSHLLRLKSESMSPAPPSQCKNENAM